MIKYLKLKNNLIAEPLVNNWHAWCNLIAPTTFSMMTENLLIPIMESYLHAPQAHRSATSAKSLKGGPFVDLSEKLFLDKMGSLLNYTRNQLKHLLDLNIDIKNLNHLMLAHPSGFSLSALYDQIPRSLRGLVELVYDLNNNPSIRLIEPLLYKSNFYVPELQSVLFYETSVDDRPFSLSTPRFPYGQIFEIRKPFNDSFYDVLFEARYKALTYEEVKNIYLQHDLSANISMEDFLSFFEEASISNQTKNAGDTQEVQYFGHACVLIKSQHINILVDPFISYAPKKDGALARFSLADLPESIDYVLITHGHLDHAVLETLLQIRTKVKCIIVPKNAKGMIQDPSLKLFLNACGFRKVIELDELEEIYFEGGKLISIPFLGEHADLNIQAKTAYAIQLENHNILCVADSDNLDRFLYNRIHDIIGDVDILFLGMESEGAPMTWLYGPLLLKEISGAANQSRRLNGSNMERAYALTRSLACKRVYIYAMGLEPWVSFVSTLSAHPELKQIIEAEKFISLCTEHNIQAARLFGKKTIPL